MDRATIKGVIDRLTRRGLTHTEPDPEDARLLVVSLTEAGRELAMRAIPAARRITEETLMPLNAGERERLLKLLDRLK
jgi:DNA-binding MarR family transcriptional regulator